MKTKLHTFILLGLIAASISTGFARGIHSTYIGPVGGNWSDPANWSPAIVPDNSGNRKFYVSVESEYPGMNLDIDVRLKKFKLTGDGSTVNGFDHSLHSCATSLGVDFPDEQFGGGYITPVALTRNVIADLGDLADFSDNSFKTGQMAPDASAADPGISSTIRFNDADIQATNGYLGLFGANSHIVDQHGRDALAHFGHVLLYGIFDVETGREFTTAGSFVNEGTTLVYSTGFIGPDAPATLVIKGDYTGIGYPLDLGTFGLLKPVAPGPSADAKVVIRGSITNYDPATRTLHKTYHVWEAAGGRSSTTQVLGGNGPFDVVNSEASLVLFGPNTGFRDRNGRDALRNLATSARLLIGDRDFTTNGSFTTTSRLSVYGDTEFIVAGDLTVQGGFFQLSPLTGYAREGEVGFPLDPEFISSIAIIEGDLNLPSAATLRFDIYDTAITATATVNGTAVFAGTLQAGAFDISQISASDTFTVLTATQITGQFSNVANGGRVDVYGDYDSLGNPLGDPIGTFLVTYDDVSLALSNFQPPTDIYSRRTPAKTFEDR